SYSNPAWLLFILTAIGVEARICTYQPSLDHTGRFFDCGPPFPSYHQDHSRCTALLLKRQKLNIHHRVPRWVGIHAITSYLPTALIPT
ncbi:hypothetical protein BDZ89DRAFT_1078716, partial [Hymenopellis radicata]